MIANRYLSVDCRKHNIQYVLVPWPPWPVHNNQVAAPGSWNLEHLEPGRCSGGSMMPSWRSDHSSMFMLITPLTNDNSKGVPVHLTRKLLFNSSCNCPWVMSASRWDINQESSMEKLSVSYNLRVLRGVSVNWDDGSKSRLPYNFPKFPQFSRDDQHPHDKKMGGVKVWPILHLRSHYPTSIIHYFPLLIAL